MNKESIEKKQYKVRDNQSVFFVNSIIIIIK
jgi:hypothetical protein